MDLNDKKVLIPGGSSDIGRAIVEVLYRSGTRNFAVAGRDEAKLLELKRIFPKPHFYF
jgi:NAD(P)-dependent dehydrogenase (short-subunit alcohol dehydrogenase family)